MSSCWRYAGNRARYWLYGRIACVSAPKKLSYQMPIRPSSTGRFCSNGAVRKCSSIAAEAGEHLAELLGTDGDHQREADRGVVRVAAADPVPELEHVGGVDAELRDLRRRWSTPRRSAWRRPTRRHRARRGASSRALRALVSVSSVVNVFDDDDEQRLGRVEVVGGLPEVGAVDVGHEPERHVAPAEVAERVVGHVRAEVGAADADVDDVADALAGVAGPLPAAHPLGEVGHLARARRAPAGTTFSPSTSITAPSGARSATCSTARSSVTLIFSPRNIASMRSREAGPSRQLEQQAQRLVGDAVLRVVEVDAVGLDGQALAALGIGGEQVAQVDVAHLLEVRSSARHSGVSVIGGHGSEAVRLEQAEPDLADGRERRAPRATACRAAPRRRPRSSPRAASRPHRAR